MNLLQLGAKSRKTGLEARMNVTKDKYDMEDVDEFFEDTTVPEIKYLKYHGRLEGDHSTLDIEKSSSVVISKSLRKTLGTGRIRRKHGSSNEDTAIELDSPTDAQNTLTNLRNSQTDVVNIDAYHLNDFEDYPDLADEDSRHSIHSENPSSELPQQEVNQHEGHLGDLRDDLNEKEVSPTLTSSLTEKKQVHNNSPTSPLPSRTSVARPGPFTKAMALGQAKQIKAHLQGSPARGNSADIFEKAFGANSTDNEDTFESDFSDNHFSPSSKNSTQIDYTQPSPLPSPPPDGLRRSKRTKIAPLAFWRNERIVYSRAMQTSTADPDSTLVSDIRKVPLQEIAEVVHIPEPPKVVSKSRRGKKLRSKMTVSKKLLSERQNPYDYESDPEIEGSEWFKEKSLETKVHVEDETWEKCVVAWAPDGGEFQEAEIRGEAESENYRLAPLFGAKSSSMSAGMIDLPQDGFKSLRNTASSLYIFHVVRGLIEVNLNSDKFVVTRGCSFKIPQNNIYGLTNMGQGTARLLFVLHCPQLAASGSH